MEKAGASRAPGADRRLRVFVHLAHNKDATAWKAQFASGSLIGINDETPYGYGRAEAMGCDVTFSTSHPDTLPQKVVRYAARLLLGFDLVHAWRQRAALRDADIIWTHTESQYLAMACIIRSWRDRPLLLGQTVWLIDTWERLNLIHRALYGRLIRFVDVVTFHSELNLQRASRIFPDRRCELVLFGIPSERMEAPRLRTQQPLKVLAVGNDRHRDWKTLIAAVRNEPGISLRIISGTIPERLVAGAQNVSVVHVKTQTELLRAFDESAIVCVPLSPNLHASGITVIQEAALLGIPIVATDTGGLRSYFDESQVRFVPPGDASALRGALLDLAGNPEAALAQARRAQARMASGPLGAEAYVRRHVDLSRELLAGKAGRTGPAQAPT